MNDAGWIALSLAGRIGKKTLLALIDHFGNDTSAILNADAKELRKIQGIGPKIAQSICAIDVTQVESSIRRWRQSGIRILTLLDTEYPQKLKLLEDAPPTLFVRGEHIKLEKSLAIVGTRSPRLECRNFAQNLSTDLAEKGYTIVSGLALGIDSAAHFGALSRCTGAVLGSGVLNIYPTAHIRLAQHITLNGFVMSEVNPDVSTSPASLVARNRIISGLSDGVIVVETSVDGGAMHAARFALQQGRRVYAVDIDASGNQALIAGGATPIPIDLQQLPF